MVTVVVGVGQPIEGFVGDLSNCCDEGPGRSGPIQRIEYENAVVTFGLVKPKPGERWILVTSAFHMPRAVGCFRRVGWRVIPYPVDFNFEGDERFELAFDLAGGINAFASGLHEWLGLTFYWLTGKTDTFFPAPGV